MKTTCELLFAGPILVKISKETEFGEAICFGGIITTNQEDRANLRGYLSMTTPPPLFTVSMRTSFVILLLQPLPWSVEWEIGWRQRRQRRSCRH